MAVGLLVDRDRISEELGERGRLAHRGMLQDRYRRCITEILLSQFSMFRVGPPFRISYNYYQIITMVFRLAQ